MKPLLPKPRPLALLIAAGCCSIGNAGAQEPEPAPDPAPAIATPPVEPLAPTPDTQGTDTDQPATEGDVREEIDRLLKELSSDDFKAREAATIKLWEMGEAAEPVVREAAKVGDIEMRTRAAHLLGLFKFGIYPDTEPEIVALINQFRYGSLFEQTSAIEKLYSLGAMETVTRLIQSVDDQGTRKRLVNAVIEELDGKLAELFAAGEFDRVESLLGVAAISDEGMRDLAAFHFRRGSIEKQINLALASERENKLSPIGYEQLSWFYRVQGDLEKASVAAADSRNESLQRDIRIAQGDLQALIKASHNPNDRTIQTYGFRAAAQRLSGDEAGLDATVATIVEYAADNPSESDECARALLINGRVAEAIEISAEGGSDRIQLLIDAGKQAEALEELGVSGQKPPYDEWLDSLALQFTAAASQQDYGRSLARANSLALLLIRWGEKAEVERIFDKLGEIATGLDLDLMPSFIANASDLGLHDLALRYTRETFAEEAADETPDADLDQLKGLELQEAQVRNRIGRRDAEESLVGALYYNQASTAGFLWSRLGIQFPDENSLKRLDQMETILAPAPLDEGEAAEAKAAAIALLETLEPPTTETLETEERADVLTELANLHLRHDNRPAAMALVKRSLELGLPNSSKAKLDFGDMLASDGRWEEATSYLKDGTEELRATPYYLYYLVRYGIALERSGQVDEAARVIELARLQALGRPTGHILVAAGFAGMGEYDRAREASQTVINIATIDDLSIHTEALRLSNYLVYDEPARAVQLKERYLIECLKGHVSIPTISSAPSIRGSIGSLEAIVDLREGRSDKAITDLRALIKQQPSNSSIIEDLYPILVEAGREKEADEFYGMLNQYGEDALALFPDSMQDLNSNAWLKARCGKDLDLALERSKRSNQLSKDNEAYLDTLAEVHFQKGERDQAITISEKAVKLSGNDFLLHHQLKRFKEAQPLSERLKEQP